MSSPSFSPTTSLPRVQLKPVEGFKPSDFLFRSATDRDYDLLIREPCTLWDGEDLVVVYQDAGPLPGFAKMLSGLKFTKNVRTAGLVSWSKTFGYSPRISVRQDYCRPSIMLRQNPETFSRLLEMAGEVSERFREANPDKFFWQKRSLRGSFRSGSFREGSSRVGS